MHTYKIPRALLPTLRSLLRGTGAWSWTPIGNDKALIVSTAPDPYWVTQ